MYSDLHSGQNISLPSNLGLSAREEIEYVAEHRAICCVYLSIFASAASDCRKLLRLDVKDLGKESARCPELSDIVLRA